MCIQIDLLKILNICPMLLQELLSVLKELTIFALLYPKRGTSYLLYGLKLLRVKNFENFVWPSFYSQNFQSFKDTSILKLISSYSTVSN